MIYNMSYIHEQGIDINRALYINYIALPIVPYWAKQYVRSAVRRWAKAKAKATWML